MIKGRFAENVDVPLFKSKLLDAKFKEWVRYMDDTQDGHPGRKLWQSYFAYQIRTRSCEASRDVEHLRAIVSRLTSHTGRDFDEINEAISRLTVERHIRLQMLRLSFDDNDLNLMSAAAYVGCLDLVEKLLDAGHWPTKDTEIFPSAMYAAAWGGHAHILERIQERLPDLDIYGHDCTRCFWRGKVGPGSPSRGSSRESRACSTRRVSPISHKRFLSGHVHLYAGMSRGFVVVDGPGLDLYAAKRAAATPETWDFLNSFFAKWPKKDGIYCGADLDPSLDLLRQARWGHARMVEHLLSIGVDVEYSDSSGPALMQAAREGHKDVVEILLAEGAEIDCKDKKGSTPLGTAETLRVAVVREDTVMVELLLDKDIASRRRRSDVLKVAVDEGLESMADLLRQHGVTPPAADRRLSL
ncbi:unnamed protein product [Parascedosporium putredinis]|uniref:Ankyrin n=1 Tax=Parascedosporium putredinis TaxID=1442378 RepID=A0A9P1H1A5_9PEZI|nr:unnamed protein product [Parascedosporium putredinis]CAI7993546.1 unnamed protein product [Parascedosporium putredinis]